MQFFGFRKQGQMVCCGIGLSKIIYLSFCPLSPLGRSGNLLHLAKQKKKENWFSTNISLFFLCYFFVHFCFSAQRLSSFCFLSCFFFQRYRRKTETKEKVSTQHFVFLSFLFIFLFWEIGLLKKSIKETEAEFDD